MILFLEGQLDRRNRKPPIDTAVFRMVTPLILFIAIVRTAHDYTKEYYGERKNGDRENSVHRALLKTTSPLCVYAILIQSNEVVAVRTNHQQRTPGIDGFPAQRGPFKPGAAR